MISHILTNQNMHALNMLSGVSIWSGLAIYIYMLDGPLGSILHPTGSSRYMATLDT